jgi:hypothetical protein
MHRKQKGAQDKAARTGHFAADHVGRGRTVKVERVDAGRGCDCRKDGLVCRFEKDRK